MRVRLRLYLKPLLGRNGLTTTALANALGEVGLGEISSSRVSEWVKGERIAKPETAFAIGETLRERFGFRTSGMEALYACGHFCDLLRLFKELTIHSEESGTKAVFAYCALPFIHKRLDDESLLTALLDTRPDAERYRELVRGASRALFELRLEPLLRDADWETDFICSDASVRAVREIRDADALPAIQGAWTNVNRSRTSSSHKITPIFVPNASATETIGAIIELSRERRLRNSVPTIAGAYLWRLASEWASETNPYAFEYFNIALPALFSPRYKVGTYTDTQRVKWASLDFYRETVEAEWLGESEEDLRRRLTSRSDEFSNRSYFKLCYSDEQMLAYEEYELRVDAGEDPF